MVEKRRGRAGVGYGDGGAAGARRLCSRVLRTAKEEQRKCKMERGMGRAGAGGVKAALWLVTAALDRTPVTRGQPRRPHGVRTLFWSATESTDSVGSEPERDA